MDIYGIETFFIGALGGTLLLTLFIYLRSRAPYLHKIPYTPTFRQSEPTFLAKKLNAVNLRKKIELKPTITGYLPVYPIEAPLS